MMYLIGTKSYGVLVCYHVKKLTVSVDANDVGEVVDRKTGSFLRLKFGNAVC